MIQLAVIALAVAIPLLSQGGVLALNYDSLHRLARVEYDNGTSIAYTYDAAGNRLTLAVSGVTPPDHTAPDVEIIQPTTGPVYVTVSNAVVVSGTAFDATGIASVNWTNGFGAQGVASGADDWSMGPLSLSNGVNRLFVSASDPTGNVGHASLVVIRLKPGVLQEGDPEDSLWTADTDGDGMPDWAEIFAGTDATNSASCLAINQPEAIDRLTNGFSFSWASVTGRWYSVYRSPDLVEGGFELLGTGIPATPPVNVYTDATALLPSAFYRVDVSGVSADGITGGVSTGEPPAAADSYLVVDLSDGPSASSYPVSYLSAAPPGGWSDEYKTTKMVFRRIPAGTFTMGSPVGELGRDAAWLGDETQRQVTLAQSFYIGVFEVTQKQWERVKGTWPSYFNNTSYRDSRPAELVSYSGIRGSSAGAGWPANNNVDADSFMGRLRARTGKTFDLPTEAQWEYAGRAGTTTALNSGKNLTNTNSCPNAAEVGRYWFNGGSVYSKSGDASVGTAKVGTYLANAWGVYDMHGNVYEWCLDISWTASSWHINRGGGWTSQARGCRVAFRKDYPAAGSYNDMGFRVVLPLDQ
jgi:YD repeat-containing protein